DKFFQGIKELEKLKIIEILEDDFFRVYSKDVLQKMVNCYERRSMNFRRSVSARLKNITSDRKLDNEHALFLNACAARYSKSEQEVVSLFRHILFRTSSPDDIKITALLNLSDFLFNSRGKKEEAVKVFREFDHKFNTDPNFVKMYATYSWAIDDYKKSIQILSDFMAQKDVVKNISHSFYLELSGLLLTYICIDAIQEKEALKAQYRYGEISDDEYRLNNSAIRTYFEDIYKKYGMLLFTHVKKISDISKLNSVSRQNVTTGMFQFVNVCIRSNKYITALDICRFVLDSWPSYLHDKFMSKSVYIERCLKEMRRDLML
uniref:hypothetical protein n=1 Tax=Solidesulfovibrio sp. TaxID=2910990 RepID=UPI0026153F6B